jgi:hypothetical protein
MLAHGFALDALVSVVMFEGKRIFGPRPIVRYFGNFWERLWHRISVDALSKRSESKIAVTCKCKNCNFSARRVPEGVLTRSRDSLTRRVRQADNDTSGADPSCISHTFGATSLNANRGHRTDLG